MPNKRCNGNYRALPKDKLQPNPTQKSDIVKAAYVFRDRLIDA